MRYFSEEYSGIEALEEALQETPDNVTLWIKLARLRLRSKEDESSEADSTGIQESNTVQALNTLSRGLEANTDSEVRRIILLLKVHA